MDQEDLDAIGRPFVDEERGAAFHDRSQVIERSASGS
jgi:hypothetical protein